MTSKEYIRSVLRSESPNFNNVNRRVLHGVLGCVTESGELVDTVKKSLFYGRSLNEENIKEEIGDIFWYIAVICNEMNWSFEEVWEANIRKLRARYPEQFTEELAANRDIDKEMKALNDDSSNP